jgi:ketosteroid isomerase-like protein
VLAAAQAPVYRRRVHKLDVYAGADLVLTADRAPVMAARYWHEDIVFEEPETLPDGGVFHGREAAMRRLQERLSIGDGRVVIDAVHDAGGDRVLAEMTVEIEPAGGGTPMTFPWWQLATVRDGRVERIREFTEREQAYAAAGLAG